MAMSNKGLHTCSVLYLINPVMPQLESHVQEQRRPHTIMCRGRAIVPVPVVVGPWEHPDAQPQGTLVSLTPHPLSQR